MKAIISSSTSGLSNIKALILSCLLLLLMASCATTVNTEIQKREADSKRDIGEAHILQGNYTAALKELLDAEKLDPDDPVTHNYLGIIYQKKQLPDLAISHFKKAIELNSGYSQARNNLGVTYLDLKEWDSAIATFKDVLSDLLYATPQFPLANIGRAYFNKKEYGLAEVYFKKALEKQPNFIVALNGLGETYITTKNYPKAIEVYEKAIQYNHRAPYLYFQLAKAYELAYVFNKSAESYQKVIDIAPGSDLAKQASEARLRIKSYIK